MAMTIEGIHERFLTSTGGSTDTRQLEAGSMFFALKGPHFDANQLARTALEAGCSYAVVDDTTVAVDDRFIVVPDVLVALQQLARHHRRQFGIPVLGITGSNGKTTTKELVHAVMRADRSTLATTGNLNNHIGVPLTLLRLKKEHRFAIIEMGANKPGDIAELCAIAEPTHGLITNIGKAHLEGFGGYEGVVRTKTEMYTWINDEHGTLFVNGDDVLLMAKSAGIPRITYGTGDGNATTGMDSGGEGAFVSVRFDQRSDHGHHDVTTHLIGKYNVPNILAAVCIGQHFGVPDDVIAGAIAGYEPTNNRSQFTDTGRNHLVLDAYNANPSSMRAALENFTAMPADRPKLALLGGMKELGAYEKEEHQALADLAHHLGIDVLFIGPEFNAVDTHGNRTFLDAESALAELGRDPVSGRLILVKGSRGTKLETLVPAL